MKATCGFAHSAAVKLALLRDTRLLLRRGPCLEDGVKPRAVLLATLPDANGWGTLECNLPVLLQAGYLAARRVSITLVNIEPVRPGPVHSRFTLVHCP